MYGMLLRLRARQTCRHTAILCLWLVAGCATRVSTYTPAPMAATAELPRPARVLITDFTIDPGSVEQDQAIGLRLERQFSGESQGGAQRALATEVRSAIGDTIVADLVKAGLPAQRVAEDTGARPGDLLVTGRVQRIDEGNRTRRLGIGFGAGKSVVEANADLYTITADGSAVLLQRYDGSADSGRKPGLGVGAASAVSQSSVVMGAVSGVSNISGEVNRTPVGKEAASLGNRLARDIGQFAAERGWIAQSSIPGWSR